MSKFVYCDRCHKQIEVRDDLVTANFFLEVLSFHESCYAKDLKGGSSFFLDNNPINGFSGNVAALFSLVAGIGFLFFVTTPLRWTGLLMIIVFVYRLYSYMTYERHLPK